MTPEGGEGAIGKIRTELLWRLRLAKVVAFSPHALLEVERSALRFECVSESRILDNAKTTLVIGRVIARKDDSACVTVFTVGHRFEHPIPLEMTLRCTARFRGTFFVEVIELWLTRRV